MKNIDVPRGPWAGRVTSSVRHWWPVPAAVATGLIAQRLLLTDRYDVGGHAAEHLAGATAPFMAAAVIFILFWATPRARRQVDLLAAAAVWFVTTLLVMAGNLRVVDDLVDCRILPHADRFGTRRGRSLARQLLGLVGRVGRPARGRPLPSTPPHRQPGRNRSSVSTLIVPPWIIPGAGVIVLAIIRVVQHGREHRPTRIVGPAKVTLREGHWPLARRRSPAPR